MVDLVIKLSPALARQIRNAEDKGLTTLGNLLAEYDLRLGEATGNTGETAQYFFVGDVASGIIDSLVERLRQEPGVEAVYPKPPDALP